MKKIFHFVFLVVASTAVAQTRRGGHPARNWQPYPVLSHIYSLQQAGAEDLPTAKTTAAPERLIATAFFDADGEMYDTTRYFYSGLRGSDLSNNELSAYFSFQYTPGNDFFPYTESFFYGGTDLRIKCDSMINLDESLQEVTGIGLKYDVADRPTLYRVTNYDLGELVEEHTFTYNASGQRTLLEYVHDTAGSSPPSLRSRIYTTYGTGGAPIQDSAVGPVGAAFQYERLEYSYAGSNLTTVMSYVADLSGAETLQSRYIFDYDASGRVTRALAQFADAGGMLGDVLKDSFAYTGTYTFPVYHKSWIAPSMIGSLVPIFEKRFTVNSAGLRDTVRYSSGTGAADGYEYYRYNTDKHAVNYVYFDPGSTTPSDSAHFYYEKYGPESIPSVLTSKISATAYPNPVASNLTLRWDAAVAGPRVHILLTDAAGRTLIAQTANAPAGKAEVDMSRLAPGLYTVTLSANNGTPLQSLKVTKQ